MLDLKILFGSKWFEDAVRVVRSQEMMRWEAHNLEMLFHIYKMFMRPLENFLQAFEVE